MDSPEAIRVKKIFFVNIVPTKIRTASSCQLESQQHKFTHKYAESFYWVEQQQELARKCK
jgi:hypothetical protein